MALKKNMTDIEMNKVSKTRPVYEETYKKGVLVSNNKDIVDRIQKEGSFVEILKHANIGDGVEAITVKIFFNK